MTPRPAQTPPMPLVSVIMPFHRVTPFLRPAIRSILDQTLRDFELLLVDDGSGAGRDALGAEGDDPRIRLLSQPRNLGIAAAHNRARAEARGEFIANMDSDDLALPTRLERQVAALRAEPELQLLGTHALAVDGAGAVLGPQFTLATETELRVFSAYSLPLTNPTLMGRRELFARFPMRPEFAISSDYDFFARAIEAGRVGCLPEVLLHYRRHAGQVTSAEQPSMVLHASLIRLVTARRRAGRPENLDELRAALGGWTTEPPAPAETYARFAQLALREGFSMLAVFLARRHFGASRRPAALARAVRVLVAAWRQSPRSAVTLGRMFATGPLRTHGLRPLRAGPAGRAGG